MSESAVSAANNRPTTIGARELCSVIAERCWELPAAFVQFYWELAWPPFHRKSDTRGNLSIYRTGVPVRREQPSIALIARSLVFDWRPRSSAGKCFGSGGIKQSRKICFCASRQARTQQRIAKDWPLFWASTAARSFLQRRSLHGTDMPVLFWICFSVMMWLLFNACRARCSS